MNYTLEFSPGEVALIHDALLDRSVREAGPCILNLEKQIRAQERAAQDPPAQQPAAAPAAHRRRNS